MCGIVGFINCGNEQGIELKQYLSFNTEALIIKVYIGSEDHQSGLGACSFVDY